MGLRRLPLLGLLGCLWGACGSFAEEPDPVFRPAATPTATPPAHQPVLPATPPLTVVDIFLVDSLDTRDQLTAVAGLLPDFAAPALVVRVAGTAMPFPLELGLTTGFVVRLHDLRTPPGIS